MKKLLMGNEAIAMGAIAAGVQMVAGYPGTPSTEVLETIAKNRTEDIYIEWSVNEKVAMEVAVGAAYAGARTLVTMKQVGLNVASDPLMCANYIGVKGGLVVLVADDPGPISSQTEQDTRHFAKYSHIPVFDPSSVEEAYTLVEKAFEISEKYQTPVIFRPTTRVCHACAAIELSKERQVRPIEGFVKNNKWVIFPPLAYKNHSAMALKHSQIADEFSALSQYNTVRGHGSKGVIYSGNNGSNGREILAKLAAECKELQLVTPYPFPEKLMRSFVAGLEEVLVVEELDSVIEQSLLELCGKLGIKLTIKGKLTGDLPVAGEYTYELLELVLSRYLTGQSPEALQCPAAPALPVRPPVLCAGCPHRASFYAVKRAMSGVKSVFSGDIGCYTLGNAQPLDMTDTCLCMGAGLTIAQGLQHMEPEVKHFGFIGDSTFFHSGITGVINSVYNNTDVTFIILDNSTTAMTGHQPHPGIGVTMMGDVSQKISIKALLEASGVGCIVTADPLNLEEAIEAVQKAAAHQGPSAVIFVSPCVAITKPSGQCSIVDGCISCRSCIDEIGCPALTVAWGKVAIDSALCTGCGLCTQICPVNAIVKA